MSVLFFKGIFTGKYHPITIPLLPVLKIIFKPLRSGVTKKQQG